jgi:hypothetical protein
LGCDVAAPIVDVPPQVRTEPILVARPQVGVMWRRAVLRAVLAPLAVLSPIVALAPTADHRFNIYWHGGLFRDDPLRIVPDTVGSLPGYLRAGNFRPLGRMVEKLIDLAAYVLTDVFGMPANVAFRLVEMVCAVVLSLAVLLLAESVLSPGPVFRRPPSTVAAVLPFAIGAGFVAAGRASPVVLFGGLYFTSSALVFAVAAAVCRVAPDARLRRRWIVPLLLGGAALAGFNEIAYFALPLATVAAAARGRYVLGVPWRRLVTGAGPIALLWLGFLPVFMAVRVLIARDCAAGSCYRGSDVHLSGAIATALPERMVAWFPPLMWPAATHGHPRWIVGLVFLLALIVLAALAVHAARDLRRLSPVDKRAAGALAVTAAALLLLGAALGALNADVQQIVAGHRWGQGWRDTAVTAAAGAVLLAAVLHGLARRRPVAVLLLFVLVATMSAAANKSYRDQLATREPARLANRVALEMADFDRTPAGDARRCALRAEFRTLYADSAFSLQRFDESLDVAARQQAGVDFCSREGS